MILGLELWIVFLDLAQKTLHEFSLRVFPDRHRQNLECLLLSFTGLLSIELLPYGSVELCAKPGHSQNRHQLLNIGLQFFNLLVLILDDLVFDFDLCKQRLD